MQEEYISTSLFMHSMGFIDLNRTGDYHISLFGQIAGANVYGLANWHHLSAASQSHLMAAADTPFCRQINQPPTA